MGIDDGNDAAADALAALKRREGHVELLKSPAEEDGQEAAERAKETAPFGPGVEPIAGRALVEIHDRRINGSWIEGGTSEVSEPRHETAGFANLEIATSRQPVIEIGADPGGVASWPTEPGSHMRGDSAACKAHPLLGDPIGEKAAFFSEPQRSHVKSVDRDV